MFSSYLFVFLLWQLDYFNFYQLRQDCPLLQSKPCHCITNTDDIPSIILSYPANKYKDIENVDATDELIIVYCEDATEQEVFKKDGLNILKNVTAKVQENEIHIILFLEHIRLPLLGVLSQNSSKSYFDGFKRITHLIIKDSGIMSIPNHALLPLNNSLEVLTIVEKDNDLNGEILFNKVVSAINGSEDNLFPKLSSLHLEFANWKSIPPNSFRNIGVKLNHLTLGSRNMEIINEDSFVGLEKNLKILHLQSDMLKKIPWKSLAKLNQILRNLTITSDHIQYLKDENSSPYSFSGLAYINLEESKINLIYSNAFEKLSLNHSLEYLIIRSNGLKNIEKYAFTGLQKLKFLDLSYNDLSNIHENMFTNLIQLDTLDLSNNKIALIQDSDIYAFKRSLTSLKLQNNKIKLYPSKLIESLSLLRELILADNKLSSLPNHSLVNMINLCSIDLSGNYLEQIPYQNLKNMKKLENLDLSGNNLKMISMIFLSYLVKLKKFNLRENNLSTIDNISDYISDKTFGITLKFLGLANNLWHCDCHINKLVKWINEGFKDLTSNELLIQTKDLNLAHCFTPIRFKGISLFEFQHTEDCDSEEPSTLKESTSSMSMTTGESLYKIDRALRLAENSMIITAVTIAILLAGCIIFLVYIFFISKKPTCKNNTNPTYRQNPNPFLNQTVIR
ncbi:unnamed protein product [Gordionus sp. m RMFG-2023]